MFVDSKSILVTGYTVSAAHEALLTNPQKIIQQIMKAPDLYNVGEVCTPRFVVLVVLQ